MLTSQQAFWIELGSVVFGLLYLWLAGKKRVLAWPMGIIGSALSVLLLWNVNLVAEAGLNLYYIVAGVYGWMLWQRPANEQPRVHEKSASWHLLVIAVSLLLGWGLALILAYIINTSPVYLDAQITVFSFLATWMTARKILSNWLYWVVIDALAIGLYLDRQLWLYAALFFVYVFLAALNFAKWRSDLSTSTA